MKTVKNARIEKLRKQLVALDCSNFELKVAEALGGQDTSFEQAFSNLAHAYLQDKAPKLLDYEVGFQLIDRNEDNTKAIGVFGFKVGGSWLYAPVFFLNGDLKGHEFLYIKSNDIFVPLKENWLNYLLNRKPNILGEGTDKDMSQLGVVSPNLQQITRSPAKYSSDKKMAEEISAMFALSGNTKLAAWAANVLPDFAHYATTSPAHDTKKYGTTPTVIDFLKDAGTRGVESLILHCETYPEIRETLNEFYGEEELNKAVKEAIDISLQKKSVLSKTAYKKATTKKIKKASVAATIAKLADDDDDDDDEDKGDELSNKAPKLRVVSYTRVMELGHSPTKGTTMDFDSDERSSLLKGKMKIEDGREDADVSVAFEIDVPQQLQSPNETGLYEVLVKPGKFKKCLVIVGPYAADGRKGFTTVVDVESGAWISTHQTEIWTKCHYQREVFNKWYEDKGKGSISGGSSMKVIVLPGGQGTLPFCVDENSEAGDLTTYDVSFNSSAGRTRPLSLPQKKWREGEPFVDGPGRLGGPSRIVLTGREGRGFRAMGRELLVPKEHKVVNLENCHCWSHSSDPSAVLDLGTLIDFQTNIIKSGELQQIELRHNGSFVSINSQQGRSTDDAVVELVTVHGLREKQARDMIETAKEKKSERFLIKYARNHNITQSPYELQKSGPSAPPFPEPYYGADPMTGGKVPTLPAFEANMVIPGMKPNVTDRSVYDPRPEAYSQRHTVDTSGGYTKRSADGEEGEIGPPDKGTMDAAMHAAETGQKEVFDTAMIGSLLKSVRDDSMVDKYMGALFTGMDRLARILFLFYWHKDEFEDRYGKQDMPELEDGLRNAFEAMGDVVLFLKQKAVDPDPDSTDVDLHSIAY